MATALSFNSGPFAGIAPIPTLAMDAFLARPVGLWEIPAHEILGGVDRAYRQACIPRRRRIADALERLEDLRLSLIAKLDAMDGDPDLEPFLSASDGIDQRWWAALAADDREDEELEPSLGASNRIDQRAWALGGAHDYEWEHDGKEPDVDEEPGCDSEIDDHFGCGWPDEGDQSTFYALKPAGA